MMVSEPAGDPIDLCLEVPAEVQQAMKVFRTRYGSRLDDPAFVRERCVELSEEFAGDCHAAQVPARTVSGARCGGDARFPNVRVILDGHFATLVPQRWEQVNSEWVGELVVDWTVHQFTAAGTEPVLPVPWVTSLDQWRAMWPQVLPAT